jgi:hypothetical protein
MRPHPSARPNRPNRLRIRSGAEAGIEELRRCPALAVLGQPSVERHRDPRVRLGEGGAALEREHDQRVPQGRAAGASGRRRGSGWPRRRRGGAPRSAFRRDCGFPLAVESASASARTYSRFRPACRWRCAASRISSAGCSATRSRAGSPPQPPTLTRAPDASTPCGRERPHRSFNFTPREPRQPTLRPVRSPQPDHVERRDRLGALIHEYSLAA